jgi:hypothetical protein
MCVGSEAVPACENPCEQCVLTGDGVVILCHPSCDPLVQECGEGQACYPFPAGDFVCAPDASGAIGGVGDPCEYINTCDPGLFCAGVGTIPACDAAVGCCSPFCNLGAADPCPDALPGTECVPYFAAGEAPNACVDWSIVGACLLP